METKKGKSEVPHHQSAVMWTSEKRERLLDMHPVLRREYRMHTPMLERTYAIVRERVVSRRTGVFFYGPPRLGKTTCAEEIQTLLGEEFPEVYVSLMSARSTQRPSDGHLFKLLLEGQRHVLANRSDPSVLFKNIKTDIQMKVASRNGSQFILIIDEMQLLNEVDLQQLLVFHNALALEKIKMTTIAFAQPEIIHKVNALQTKEQTQIIARFLSEPLTFEGCISVTELRALLLLYDEESEFPDNSRVSYTQFFFPEAFSYGFQLNKYANKIWSAFKKVVQGFPDTGLPMEHVCLTIEHLLLAHRQYDAANFTFGDDDITEAVESSNLRNFISYVWPAAE